MDRRVVVTGMGAVTPLGEMPDLWKRLVAGQSGVRAIDPAWWNQHWGRYPISEFSTRIAARCVEFDPERWMPLKEYRRIDRFMHVAYAASAMALHDASLDFRNDEEGAARAGVVMASGIGGIESLFQNIETLRERGPSRISPLMIPAMIANMGAGYTAIGFNLQGPSSAPVTACAASANAIGDATEIIRRNLADVMVAGGSEAAIGAIGLGGFASMRAMSTRNDEPERASRPFDLDRDGFVMGEGAGAVILEEREHAIARGAEILAEVVGYGMSTDAHHVTLPSPGGRGASRAMQSALDSAGLGPADIDYINAHGTSTPANDSTESAAIRTTFGADAPPVSSTKSMTGHLLGAAGAVEAIVCIQAIREGVMPPTINLDTPDPECDLDYVPHEARDKSVRYAMSNSFGFGGHNVALILAKA